MNSFINSLVLLHHWADSNYRRRRHQRMDEWMSGKAIFIRRKHIEQWSKSSRTRESGFRCPFAFGGQQSLNIIALFVRITRLDFQFPTVYNKCKNNAIHWKLETHFCSDNNVRFWLRFSKNKRTTTKVIDHRDRKEVAVSAPLWSWSPSAWQCQSRWNGKQSVGCWIICSRCFVDNNSEFNLWSMYNIDSCKIIRKKCAKKGFDADTGMNE